MKILRSVTRRGFSFGTAGYFSVLKPNTWFPATRLPGRFRYRPSQSGGQSAVQERATASPKIMTLGAERRGMLQPALTVLAAAVITAALLMWIMHP